MALNHYLSPEAWAEGADPAYEALSRAIVAASPRSLADRLVLDLGAGTGATARALAAVGARPVGVDLSLPMLAHDASRRPPAFVADMIRLPMPAACADGAVAAFSLSHVDDPGAVLAEARRVSRGGAPVIAGVFATAGSRHPAKDVVDALARDKGWSPPDWYAHLKDDLEPRVADPETLAAWARAAGLVDVVVEERDVDAGLYGAQALVGWRLSLPALAPFVSRMTPAVRRAFERAAADALGPDVQPLRPAVRILVSVVPADR